MPEFKSVERGYRNLWNQMRTRPERVAIAQRIAKRLNSNRTTYERVEAATGVPWYFVAITHQLESSANFSKHLHNGDPLTARTKRVPKGRPKTGKPPFTWWDSAMDALTGAPHSLHKIDDWSLPRVLYEFERYNGFGYYGKVASPYLWSFSFLYDKGKYVGDGEWSASAVSKQCGAAVILKAMCDLGFVSFKQEDFMKQFEASILPLGAIAPILIKVAGSEYPMLAVKALAEALNMDNSEPEKVIDVVEKTPYTALVEAAKAAEALVEKLDIDSVTPPEPKTPDHIIRDPYGNALNVDVPEPEPKPKAEPGKIDKVMDLGTGWLTGLKTVLGVVGWVIVTVLGVLGYLPADTVTALQTATGGLVAVGLLAKLERFSSWVGPIVKLFVKK